MGNYHTSQFMQVTDVTLMVSNIERSLKFYHENMGFKLLNKNDNLYELGTHTGIKLITLMYNPLATPKMRTTGLYHYAILLPSRKDLGEFIKHMIETKTPVTGGADHGISEALYLDDPDGNGIEIYADKPKDAWPAFDEVVNKPMDYQGLVNLAADGKFTKIPDATIMGHIHLHVASIQNGRKFFVDTLGFQNTMEYGPHAAFVSDLGYHHHVGFNVWNGQNISNNPDNTVGLKAYTLYVPSSRYDALLTRLKDAKIALEKDKDQVFVKDLNNVKVYLKTKL